MRSMNELRPFYRLLNIPEDTATPSPFQLLGLPAVHSPPLTREQIEQAVLDRKKQLRQNIPGPQALPIMSLVEQAMDRAAASLLKHLDHAGGPQLEQSAQRVVGDSSGEPTSGPAKSPESPPRPAEHASRPHSRPAAVAGPPVPDSWQDALQWVITESRSLYHEARRRGDLRSATEALRSYLTARRFLQLIDKE